MTMYLIKNTKFSLYELHTCSCLDSSAIGACMILLLAVVLQSHPDCQLKHTGKNLAMSESAAGWNWLQPD